MSIALAKTLIDMAELRAGSVITEREILALKKRWRPHGKIARSPAGAGDEMLALHDALPMQVSDEQAKKGLDYLRKLLLRKNGDPRATKLALDQGFGDEHAAVLHMLDHFLFMGFHEDCNAYGNVRALYPIYRAVANGGAWFEYVARPWVGGLPTFGRMHEELT